MMEDFGPTFRVPRLAIVCQFKSSGIFLTAMNMKLVSVEIQRNKQRNRTPAKEEVNVPRLSIVDRFGHSAYLGLG